MQLISMAIIMALATVGTSVPAAINEIAKRQTCPVANSGCLRCTARDRLMFHAYGVYIPDDRIIDVDCGRGVLDNVRGCCGGGAVTNWQCEYINGGPAAQLYFNVDNFCTLGDVANAIRAAGQGHYDMAYCGLDPVS